jgi:predicted O-linked N-acetylglucosamine transferase (SPINDLY family)
MEQAAQAYIRGEWARAEWWCRRILAGQTEYFDALHLLGIIAAQMRRTDEAAHLLGRAVAANPSDAAAHNNYGNVLKSLRRFEDALNSYQHALRIEPAFAEAHNNRGLTLQDLKRFHEALDCFEHAVWIKPAYAEAHFNRGAVLQELRRFTDALESYERAVKIKPDYAEAHNNSGLILRELTHSADALDNYERALKIKPDYAEAYNNRGLILRDLKRVDEALDDYEHALKFKPDLAEAHHNRGDALRDLGRYEDALDSYERALKIKPDYAEAWNNHGETLQELRRFADALGSYERALSVRPEYVEVYFNRGAAFQDLARFEEALDSYERALKLKPDLAEAHNNRGNMLREFGRFEEALDSYEHALKIKPNYAEAHNNRGNALRELRRLEEALDSYGRALNLNPGLVEALNNRGNALRELRRFEEALDSYERALKFKADYAEAYSNRGATLRDLGRFEDAIHSYEQALQLKPDHGWLHGMWLHARMHICDWNDFDFHIDNLIAGVEQGRKTTPPFAVLAITDSLEVQHGAAQIWAASACAPGTPLPAKSARGRSAKIRLGYYSADYGDHPVSQLTVGLFEEHDRERFEVVAFSSGPPREDEMSCRLKAAFDQFVDVRGRSDRDVVRLSRDFGIDIAVDLMGFTGNARTGVFASRAAPIQVNFLGYPGTMAATCMDYLIADRTVIPAASRALYAEKIVYLPHSFQPNDRKRPIADREFPREELGLPPTAFVFCSFNNIYKITPAVFGCWMRILGKVDESVLWLVSANDAVRANLRREAAARGVSPDRLIFAGRLARAEDHLARHRAADLFLDTFPFNAHTTASNALWAGLPVLTRMGDSYAARVAASLLRAVGLAELITETDEEYEALAVDLAGDRARCSQLRETLYRNRLVTPLFDTVRYTRYLESAYRTMHERYRAGDPPEFFEVPA